MHGEDEEASDSAADARRWRTEGGVCPVSWAWQSSHTREGMRWPFGEEAARSGMGMWAGGNMKGMLEVSRSGTVREEQA